MLKESLLNHGTEIAGHLRNAETAEDTSLASQARLFAAMLDARRNLKLAHCSQQTLFSRAADLLVQGIERRATFMELHGAFSGLGERFGMDAHAFGDGGDKSDVVLPAPTGELINLDDRRVA